MGAFVVLALALAVVALAGAGLVTRELVRRGKALRAGVDAATAAVNPLLGELSEESGVVATEVQALTTRAAALRASRADGRRGGRLR